MFSELHWGGPDLPRARRRGHCEGVRGDDDLHARAGRHGLAQEAPQGGMGGDGFKLEMARFQFLRNHNSGSLAIFI